MDLGTVAMYGRQEEVVGGTSGNTPSLDYGVDEREPGALIR